MRRRNSLSSYSRLLTVHFPRLLPVLASLPFTLRAHSSGLPPDSRSFAARSFLIFFPSYSPPRILCTFPSPLNPTSALGRNLDLFRSVASASQLAPHPIGRQPQAPPSLRAPSPNSHPPLPPLTAPDNGIPTSPFSLGFPPTALSSSPRRSPASFDAPLPAQFPLPFPLSPPNCRLPFPRGPVLWQPI